jgi:hypothetical protein
VRADALARGLVHGCVRVALFIYHSTRLRHIVTSFLATLTPTHFLHYLINGAIFGKKIIESKMWVSIFSTPFV